ncbi:hypothetical protein TW95_gp1649 [Pandoravirus inopinatum]|uniref:Transmembrane protein n=1 Tax=Pandoravirus inopinatum TaxID=1605721 RepID=A0A0B5IZN0_9VIRU|nr:hypothetical protein TW95_gp1649 [Pandoravirus inopinatum]AJF98383.1 hypothetical protein [Pandoravirus inopinatum]
MCGPHAPSLKQEENPTNKGPPKHYCSTSRKQDMGFASWPCFFLFFIMGDLRARGRPLLLPPFLLLPPNHFVVVEKGGSEAMPIPMFFTLFNLFFIYIYI